MLSGEADAARDIKARHVQMIGAAQHFGEQPLLPILNVNHAESI
jgi:hypothetical protein